MAPSPLDVLARGRRGVHLAGLAVADPRRLPRDHLGAGGAGVPVLSDSPGALVFRVVLYRRHPEGKGTQSTAERGGGH